MLSAWFAFRVSTFAGAPIRIIHDTAYERVQFRLLALLARAVEVCVLWHHVVTAPLAEKPPVCAERHQSKFSIDFAIWTTNYHPPNFLPSMIAAR
jgi:hypothetical protein